MISHPHLLIVDDDDLFRAMIVVLLQHKKPHFRITEARDGQEAYAHYQQHGADLVLTDDDMPVMTGTTLVQTLRAAQINIPIVMLISRVETRQAIIDDVHTLVAAKPIVIDDLVLIIDFLLASH